MMERAFRIGNSRKRMFEVLSVLSNFLIKDEDDYELWIGPARQEKTPKQRKTWHALLTEFGKAIGHTMPEMKIVVKREILGSSWIKMPNGKDYEIIPSSEDEERYGYANLIDQTLRIAAENGVLLEIKSERRAA